jgi:hypothetical protein
MESHDIFLKYILKVIVSIEYSEYGFQTESFPSILSQLCILKKQP